MWLRQKELCLDTKLLRRFKLKEQFVALWQRIVNRRSHYRSVFRAGFPSADFVLADLRRFCRAGEPPLVIGQNGQTDIYATGMAAGRQDVFWRIANHLYLDDAKLLHLKETMDREE